MIHVFVNDMQHVAIRYVPKGSLFKAFYYKAPYLSVVFLARLFWYMWYVLSDYFLFLLCLQITMDDYFKC